MLLVDYVLLFRQKTAYDMRNSDWCSDVCSSDHRDCHSLDQVMLALLRAKPDAFIKVNINLVKAGAVLRIPDGSELSEYSAREARAIVHEQIGQWREMRKAAEQPAAVAAQDEIGRAHV